MEIELYVKKATNVHSINLYMKIPDDFTWSIVNTDWDSLCEFDAQCVPDFFPWDHYGDYLILEIELDTWKILNWTKPTKEQLTEFIKNNPVE